MLAKKRHIPLRSCVACGKKMPKQELLRVVRTPHGTVTLDPNGKSPGRGAYLCWTSSCWKRGLAKKGLERSLGMDFTAEDREQVLAMRLNLGPDSADGPPTSNNNLDV